MADALRWGVIDASLLLAPREPLSVAAAAARNDHGIDVSLSGWLDLGRGLTATAEASFESVHRRSLDLIGTNGSLTIESNLAPGPTEPSVVEVVRLDDSVSRFPAAGADSYGEMLDQFVAVTNGEKPLWGEAESRLMARWIEALLQAAA